MSLGPTELYPSEEPGFVGGWVHNLEPVTTTNISLTLLPNALSYSRQLHYQLTGHLPLRNKLANEKGTDGEVRSTDDARRGTTDENDRYETHDKCTTHLLTSTRLECSNDDNYEMNFLGIERGLIMTNETDYA